MKFRFFLLLFVISLMANSAESKKMVKPQENEIVPDDPSLQFKETKFLQIDRINVPQELKAIEEQIRQNLVDVILVSKTHTPIYAQKREGYNESYKKFYGVQVRIAPLPGSADLYEVSYFYYNWTANKFDKTIYKRISKFNVLNEMRFGMYELLLGKDYVVKNKDVIDVQNYDRIQAVRKAIAEEKKNQKSRSSQKNLSVPQPLDNEKGTKKKLIREDKEKENKNKTEASGAGSAETDSSFLPTENSDEEEVEPDSALEKVKPTEIKNNRERSSRKKLKKDIEKEPSNSTKLEVNEKRAPEVSTKDAGIKYTTIFNGKTGIALSSNTSVTADAKIKANSNFKFITVGGDFDMIQEIENPLQYGVHVKVGMPIMKGGYEVPSHKMIDLHVGKNNFLLNHSLIKVGLQYSPVNFVNVPDFGTGFQVFENNFLWLKLGGCYEAKISRQHFKFNLAYLQSMMSSSSQKKTLSGNQIELAVSTMFTEKYGVDLSFSTLALEGDFKVTGREMSLQMIYRFEN